MSELKTQPTGASVTRFISTIPDPGRRGDCRTLASIMKRATGAKAEMWGPSIVGFGRFQYGPGGERTWFFAGFSPRKNDLTVYVMGGLRENAALLAKLGRHRTSGGGCLYLKRLAEVDLHVLETLIARSAATLRAMETAANEPRKTKVVAKAIKPARPVTKTVTKTVTESVTKAKPRPARAATTARRAR
jgi:uncharacterized protein DUF1801